MKYEMIASATIYPEKWAVSKRRPLRRAQKHLRPPMDNLKGNRLERFLDFKVRLDRARCELSTK